MAQKQQGDEPHEQALAASMHKAAGLDLVLLAALYDAFLTLAIVFVAAALAVIANGGQAITDAHTFFKVYLFVAAFPYFGWCWTHSGQTLGMRTWKIQIRHEHKARLQLHDAALRYVAAALSWLPLGLGFFWILVDRKKRSWHDLISQTSIIKLAD